MSSPHDILQQIATEYGIQQHAVFCWDGVTYAFLYLTYAPQREVPLMVDNYYPAYQQVRRARLALENALGAYPIVPIKHPYKYLAVLSGMVRPLRNSLTALGEGGSWFVMEAVALDGCYAPEVARPIEVNEAQWAVMHRTGDPMYAATWYEFCLKRMHPACNGCDRCRRACPVGAIGEKLDGERCLRSRQQEGYIAEEEVAKKMANRVLGCHTCQMACPLNTAACVPPSVDGEALLRAATSGKRALLPFADCLGNNYLRPARLTALCLNALTNARDGRFRELALAARDRFDEPMVQRAVDRYLSATPDIEREVKRMLTPTQFETFAAMAAAHDGVTHTQVNYYFDAGEWARARIRLREGMYTLTLKRHIDRYSLQEHNATVTREEAEHAMQYGLPPDLVHRYLGLALPAVAPYLGYLTTRRTTWHQEGLKLELDSNEYLDRQDLEIECEVDGDAMWDKAVAFITGVAPTAWQDKGKQARFERAARAAKK